MQLINSQIVIVIALFSSFLLCGHSQPVNIEKDGLLENPNLLRSIRKNSAKQNGGFRTIDWETTMDSSRPETPTDSTVMETTTESATTETTTYSTETTRVEVETTSSAPDYTGTEETTSNTPSPTTTIRITTTQRTTNSTTVPVITSTVELYPCVNQTDNSNIYANPDDCSTFFICSNGFAYLYDCPEDLVFNPLTKQCDFSYNVPGCQSD